MEVTKSPDMVKKTDMRGIPRYGELIDVWSEVNISIEDYNLPTPDNTTVPESGA